MRGSPDDPVPLAVTSPVEGPILVGILRGEGIEARTVEPLGTGWDPQYTTSILVRRGDLARAQHIVLDVRGQADASAHLRRCTSCDYSLDGLAEAGVCPECGEDLVAARRAALLLAPYQSTRPLTAEPGAASAAESRARPGVAARLAAASMAGFGALLVLGALSLLIEPMFVPGSGGTMTLGTAAVFVIFGSLVAWLGWRGWRRKR